MKLKKKAVVSVAMCLSLILVGQPVYGETNNNPAKPTTDIVSSQFNRRQARSRSRR